MSYKLKVEFKQSGWFVAYMADTTRNSNITPIFWSQQHTVFAVCGRKRRVEDETEEATKEEC
jgi:hypothetical protein